MPAFTPGPWKAEPMVPHAENAFYITATPDGNNSAKDVATVGPCLAKTTEPNAYLIAAAPELYEALEKVADSLEAELQARYPVEAEGHAPYPDMKRRYDRDVAEVHEARAALAKARGESA